MGVAYLTGSSQLPPTTWATPFYKALSTNAIRSFKHVYNRRCISVSSRNSFFGILWVSCRILSIITFLYNICVLLNIPYVVSEYGKDLKIYP